MQVSLNRSKHCILLSLKAGQPTINLVGSRYKVLRDVVGKMEIQVSEQMYSILWTDAALGVREIKAEQGDVKINHVPEVTQITRKNKMTNNLNSLRLHFPKDYDFYPESWVLPSDYHRILKRHQKGKVYIVKPQNGCQGQGIYLTTTPHRLQRQSNLIVQQYLPNPMLLDGLKFDLRIYVLLTCINPLRVYLYHDGLVRCATEEFQKVSQANIGNHFAHLTNYAINKLHQKFKVDDQNQNNGHKRLLTSVFKNEDYKDLMDRFGKIVLKTVISGLPAMQDAGSQCKRTDPNAYFQLLGFDIMLTDKKQPVLVEVNQNPSLSTDTALDHRIKTELVKNIMEMVTGGYKVSSDQRHQTKVKLKDKHEFIYRGNFSKIYPCQSLDQTQHYDQFILKSQYLYKQRFGIGIVRGVRSRKAEKEKEGEEELVSWNEQPSHYTQDKVEQVYGTRMSRTSNNRKRLMFI